MSLPNVTEADIRALANEKSFNRGYNYFQDGAVSDVVQREKTLSAAVQGNHYAPYQVQITYDENGITDTTCTCPYDWGGICKHVVAVLLATLDRAIDIEQRPSLTSLLTPLSATQLRQLLLDLIEMNPDLTETIEREVQWLQEQGETADSKTPVAVDLRAVRREIQKDFRLAGHGDPYEYGYYDEYAALEIDPEGMVTPHLEKVGQLLDAGDVATAESLITTILDAYAAGVSDLEEWVYEYNEEVLADANIAIGAALAEVLLSQNLKSSERQQWQTQIKEWEQELGDLEIAQTALEHGWTYSPLVAAMDGHISRKGAWEGEAPFFADELAQARLRILERQQRYDAYINLAAAEGQQALSIVMRVRVGDVDTAVSEAKAYLSYPSEILTVAKALAETNEMAAALAVGQHGMNMEQQYGMRELAAWVRDQAQRSSNWTLSLQAAQTAFEADVTLVNYTAVQKIAGAQWPDIQPQLLHHMQQQGYTSDKIDIYLQEGMLVETMQAVDQAQMFVYDRDLDRVVTATQADYPDWGIGKYKKQAERIMDAGESKSYDTAVGYLQKARQIYLQHNRQSAWHAYLDDLLDIHHRKYKLAPMLRNIR